MSTHAKYAPAQVMSFPHLPRLPNMERPALKGRKPFRHAWPDTVQPHNREQRFVEDVFGGPWKNHLSRSQHQSAQHKSFTAAIQSLARAHLRRLRN